jgi:hypothetical protein
MANYGHGINTYSRSNVAGDPYLWRPTSSDYRKIQEIPLAKLTSEHACDNVNDFETTYVSKRIWIAQTGTWLAPPYVQCEYVV